jgi:hypothetical protein
LRTSVFFDSGTFIGHVFRIASAHKGIAMKNRSDRLRKRRPDPVGLLMIGVFAGALSAALAVIMGSSWWAAILFYSLGGSAGILGAAIFFCLLNGRDPSEKPTGAVMATSRDALS